MADATRISTLLLLPGLLCDARLWRDQVAALHTEVRCVVADLSQDDTLEAMVARAVDPLPDRFAVAGLSMGGYAALTLLRLHPHRVSRLCLMDTSARPDTPEAARRRRGMMALIRGGGRFRGVTPALLPQLLHPANLGDAGLREAVMAMADRLGPESFLRQQAAILARGDSRPGLRAITAPTLVMVGEADQLTPVALAREIVEGIPGAALRVIAGAGHLPPLEQPAIVTGLLRDWLAPG